MNVFALPLGEGVLKEIRNLPAEVLLVVPYGSYAHGTRTAKSDLDCFAVFCPTKRQVGLQEVPEFSPLKFKADGKLKEEGDPEGDAPGEVTIEFLSLSRLCSDFIRGVPAALEVMSYIKSQKEAEGIDPRFRREGRVIDFLMSLGESLTGVDVFPLLSFAKKNVDFIKDRANRLRTFQWIKGWVEGKYAQGHQKLAGLSSALIEDLLREGKGLKGLEPYSSDQIRLFGKPFGKRLSLDSFARHVEAKLGEYGPRTLEVQEKGVDFRSLAHAVRCVVQAKELMLQGSIRYPLKDAPLILSIKNQELSKEEVHQILVERFEEIGKLLASVPNFQSMLSSGRDSAYEFVSRELIPFYLFLWKE